jgi:hypothetical protein
MTTPNPEGETTTKRELIDSELGAEPSRVQKVSFITGYGQGTATAGVLPPADEPPPRG